MHEDRGKVNSVANNDANQLVGAPPANLGKIIALLIFVALGLVYLTERSRAQQRAAMPLKTDGFDSRIDRNAQQMLEQGRQIFRYDTFGDEVYWTDTLKLHRAIEGEKLGGVGPGVSPKTALSVGLKVDMDALPADLVEKVKKGEVNLDDPATTLALIKLDAVLGVKGTFNQNGSLKSVGLSCALCHSTVDDAFAPGIGHRLDGWPNRDLDSGAIISLAPDPSVFTKLLRGPAPVFVPAQQAMLPGATQV